MIDFQKHAEDISPEFAALLLQKNGANRPLNLKTVERYAGEMKRGSFKANGEPIIVGSDDTLLDGQHRLQAIVKAGVTMKMLVVCNVPNHTFDTIDVGRIRSKGDVLAIAGYKNSTNMGSVIRRIMLYERGIYGHQDSTLSNQQIVQWAEQHPTITTITTDAFAYYARFRLISISEWGLLLWMLLKKDKQMAYDFLEKLSTGSKLSEPSDEAILLLRNRLISDSGLKPSVYQKERLALFITAWNYYRRNFPAKTLRWTAAQEFPKPI